MYVWRVGVVVDVCIAGTVAVNGYVGVVVIGGVGVSSIDNADGGGVVDGDVVVVVDVRVTGGVVDVGGVGAGDVEVHVGGGNTDAGAGAAACRWHWCCRWGGG